VLYASPALPSYLLYVVALGRDLKPPIILARFLALMICGDFPSRFCMHAKVVHDENKFVPATAALWDLDHLREVHSDNTPQNIAGHGGWLTQSENSYKNTCWQAWKRALEEGDAAKAAFFFEKRRVFMIAVRDANREAQQRAAATASN